MTLPIHEAPACTDWQVLWRYGACWAGRPIAGVILPGDERMKIMLAVMEQFMAQFPTAPGELQCYAFVQTEVTRRALEAVRMTRSATGDLERWHDSEHRLTTPVLDLVALQEDVNSRVWQDVLTRFRPVSFGALTQMGLGDTDADDVFSESLASLAQPRHSSGTAVLADLLVFEQLPPLFLQIVRRRAVNFIRDRSAAKRSAHHTVSLENADPATQRSALSTWEADENDPLHGLTLAKLAAECADRLSALQQHILSVLYIEESATYMEVAGAEWFAQAVGLKPGSSDATKRRALDREHDSALDHLAHHLGISTARREK
jgi:hypothetical protein